MSSGKVAIPNVVGMTQADASTELYNLGFVVSVIERQDDTVAAGTVLEQSPVAGKSALPGTTITIYVSVLPVDPSESPLG